MTKKSLKVDRYLYEVLRQKGPEEFTTTELRDRYIKSLLVSDLNASFVRKYIYKQILRLEKIGVVQRKPGSTGKGSKFVFHDPSGRLHIRSVESPFAPGEQSKAEAIHHSPVTPVSTLLDELKEQIKLYQVELMASVGEAEEYMRLCRRYPPLKERLERQHREARDRSSKLLGQVRAVEAVLKGFSGPQA